MTTTPAPIKVEFHPQPKIARFNRQVIVTEKIDGTNAAVLVHEDGRVEACSKNRVLIDSEPDNFGFRAWVKQNEDGLRQLGPGLHRGEWWGQGIGRKYGGRPKTFSLFNVQRWFDPRGTYPLPQSFIEFIKANNIVQQPLPDCVSLVPVLGVVSRPDGPVIDALLGTLRDHGSVAQPGFAKPEGIVLFHTSSQQLFKITTEKDESYKGASQPDNQ